MSYILIGILGAVLGGDLALYILTVTKCGPQWNLWPLSGYWVAWKKLCKKEEV